MIGRGGFHGFLRNVRVSPWTRRSLTESLLLSRTASAAKAKASKEKTQGQQSPSTRLTLGAWRASVTARLHKDKLP
jgi:hypothetical protein